MGSIVEKDPVTPQLHPLDWILQYEVKGNIGEVYWYSI